MKTLITAADIKQYTAVSLNAEQHKLSIAIPDAQSRHLRPLIGPVLLQQLLDFVKPAPEPPVTTGLGAQAEKAAQDAYATQLDAWRTAYAGPLLDLWDQVKPMLSQWALVEAWPYILVHIDAAGVVLKTGKSEGTTTADAATLNQVKASHRDTAIWRGSELVAWLESKKSAYPAYTSTKPAATGLAPIDYCGGISL